MGLVSEIRRSGKNLFRGGSGSATSVADPGCLSRIPDPTFSIPDPNCLHPGSRILIKQFKYFNPQKSKKNGFQDLKNMIRVVHPGSRIPDPDADFLPSRIPDPGSRGQKGTQSWIRIRNTVRNTGFYSTFWFCRFFIFYYGLNFFS